MVVDVGAVVVEDGAVVVEDVGRVVVVDVVEVDVDVDGETVVLVVVVRGVDVDGTTRLASPERTSAEVPQAANRASAADDPTRANRERGRGERAVMTGIQPSRSVRRGSRGARTAPRPNRARAHQ